MISVNVIEKQSASGVKMEIEQSSGLPVKEKVWYLKKINIFSNLEPSEMDYIVKNSKMKNFKKGSTIYFGESDHDKIFFLKKGKVKLLKIDTSGKEMVYAILKENEIFGSLSQLKKNIDNEFAEALSDTLVCYVKKNLFFNFIKNKPSLVLHLNRLLSRKVFDLELLVEELTFRSVMDRIISLFIKLNEKFGANYHGNILINLSLTHNDIASMVGATRESTTIALNILKGKKLINSERKKIIIINLEELKKISEY